MVRVAVNQMKKDKTPGMDGITMELFQRGGEPLLELSVSSL